MANKQISTVIEITDTHIKLLQTKDSRGRRILSVCEMRPVRHHTDDEIINLLTELTRSRNITAEDMVVAVARRQVILKHMKLPSTSDHEIQKMAGLQLVNSIPYALDEVIYDLYPLERDASGYTKVLAVVLSKEISEWYLKILRGAGLGVGRLTLSSFGILEWLNYQDDKKKIDATVPMMLINVDAKHSEICFTNQKKLVFSRSISYGGEDILSDGGVNMIDQIRLSIATYQKENMGPALRKTLILSSLKDVGTIRERMEKEIKLPVELFTSFENILCHKKINLSVFKEQAGLSVTVGVGLLLSKLKQFVNLTPKEIHDTKVSKERKKQIAAFVVLLILAVVLGLSSVFIELYQKNKYLALVKAEVKKTIVEVKRIDETKGFVEYLKNEFSGRIIVSDIILELYRHTPPEISFRSISLDRKGQLVVQGYAEVGTSVNSFQNKLVNSPVFKDVNLQFVTKRKIYNLDVTDFKINCQLTKVKNEL